MKEGEGEYFLSQTYAEIWAAIKTMYVMKPFILMAITFGGLSRNRNEMIVHSSWKEINATYYPSDDCPYWITQPVRGSNHIPDRLAHYHEQTCLTLGINPPKTWSRRHVLGTEISSIWFSLTTNALRKMLPGPQSFEESRFCHPSLPLSPLVQCLRFKDAHLQRQTLWNKRHKAKACLFS